MSKKWKKASSNKLTSIISHLEKYKIAAEDIACIVQDNMGKWHIIYKG